MQPKPNEDKVNKKEKTVKTYNAAADSFDKGPLDFWNVFGRETVKISDLKRGDQVLDVCCGSGASAIPAAEIVGDKGSVIAIDLAERLLERGRDKARTRGLEWLEFKKADMTQLDFQERKFDLVICVFGIFFVKDMAAQLNKLWQMVKPKGQLLITTWGAEMFVPAYEIWAKELSSMRPELFSDFNPWDEITTRDGIESLFSKANIPNVAVEVCKNNQELKNGADFWTIAMGSGLRWAIEQLDSNESQLLKEKVVSEIEKNNITYVKNSALIAKAVKPAFPSSINKEKDLSVPLSQ